ncbi:hypothetical protein [Paenibacillus puerhi]|uniref:hypothetical protein n=1 Tax=Paenibacillus puerhi TaxID=2692622 RepID=UPI00135A2C16|nr:hypothetical protein [Paenibacillus puerhi]
METEKQIQKLKTKLPELRNKKILEQITIEGYRDFKKEIDLMLEELTPKLAQMELELAKALNTSYDANEILLILETSICSWKTLTYSLKSSFWSR